MYANVNFLNAKVNRGNLQEPNLVLHLQVFPFLANLVHRHLVFQAQLPDDGTEGE